MVAQPALTWPSLIPHLTHSLQCVPDQSPALQLPVGTSIHSVTQRTGRGQEGLLGPFQHLLFPSITEVTGEQWAVKNSALGAECSHAHIHSDVRHTQAHTPRQTHSHREAHTPLLPNIQTHSDSRASSHTYTHILLILPDLTGSEAISSTPVLV